MKKLSIIIVNYRTREILEDCLKNLQKLYPGGLKSPSLEVIVVDNEPQGGADGASDGSADMVASKFPDVTLIRSINDGLAAGSNKGLIASSGDYLLYLGTDAFPQENTIQGLMDYMEANKQVGVATCELVTRDGAIDMDAHRGFPTPWTALTHFAKLDKVFPKSRFFANYFMGYSNLHQSHEIDLCISHFMFIRREVFEKIGQWDPQFFLFGEDVDFCYRVKQAGFKIMYLPGWRTLHYKGVSVGTRATTKDLAKTPKEWKKKMRVQTTTAMKLFYEKHYKTKYPHFVTAFVLFAVNILGRIRNLQD